MENNAVDEAGYTPLMYAAEAGDLAQVRFLLENGADPNATSTGEAALHKALAQDHLTIAQLLIAAKADVNQPDVDGYRPLAFAKSERAIEMLLAAGAEAPGDGGDDQIDLLERLGGAELAAYAHGLVETQQPGYRGTPLHAAAALRNLPLMQEFIGSGTPVSAVDRKRRTPVHWLASRSESQDAAWRILRHWAAQQGRQDALEQEASLDLCFDLLRSHGADLEARDANQNTPLLAAMQWEQHETARYLVHQGAQVTVQDITGWTPVILAANTDDIALLDFLLEHGGSLEEHRAGWGPLNYAAHHGKTAMVRHLLSLGADPNRIWDQEPVRLQLPVHSAAFMGHLEIVRLLLAAGSSANTSDGDGNTPLDYARQQKEQGDALRALMGKFRFGAMEEEPDGWYDKPWNEIIQLLKEAS